MENLLKQNIVNIKYFCIPTLNFVSVKNILKTLLSNGGKTFSKLKMLDKSAKSGGATRPFRGIEAKTIEGDRMAETLGKKRAETAPLRRGGETLVQICIFIET